jgi:beta-galactosidase beta subunit
MVTTSSYNPFYFSLQITKFALTNHRIYFSVHYLLSDEQQTESAENQKTTGCEKDDKNKNEELSDETHYYTLRLYFPYLSVYRPGPVHVMFSSGFCPNSFLALNIQ